MLFYSLIVLILLITGFYAYYGGFTKPDILITECGSEVLIYKKAEGDYKKSGEIGNEIYYSLLNEDKVETYKGFGVYYDNPRKTETSKLRFEAGCILEEKDYDKLSVLEKKYLTRTFPSKKYITAEFPYKGKASVIFGVMKVIPALAKYAVKKGYDEDGAIMEIYDVPNQKIFYRKEILNK